MKAVVASLVLALLGWSDTASAEDRLQSALDASAREARLNRRAFSVTSVVGAALTVPVGTALWSRSDHVERTIGAGFAIGGAAPLAFSLLALAPSPVERLAARHGTELEWEEVAETAHQRRIVSAIVEMTLGGLAAASGDGLLFARHDVAGLDLESRATVGGILLGAGIPVLLLGIRNFIVPTPEERGWASYRGGGYSF